MPRSPIGIGYRSSAPWRSPTAPPRELGELAATTTKLPAHHLLPDAAADSNAPAEEADPHHAVVSRNRTPRGP
jgi:hypothetical protein